MLSDSIMVSKNAPLNFYKKTHIMGILNVTPDSFSDGGRYFNTKMAIERALEMLEEGADIIDIGGESTRPGADLVSVDSEIERVIPVIEGILSRAHAVISVDTRKSTVASAALERGASIVNDISYFEFDPAMPSIISKFNASVILMHSRGDPKTMQIDPNYKDVMGEISECLSRSIEVAKGWGILADKIIVDPGIGFGKKVEHNLEILKRLSELKSLGCPICIGTSRKSFIGAFLGVSDPIDRLPGTLASSVVAVINGANILRVHDVKEAVQASLLTDSILNAGT